MRRLRAAGLALGAAIMALSLIAGPAAAAPSPSVTDYGQLAGVGDDRTQDVMTALGAVIGGGGVIDSWAARGSETVTTKDPLQYGGCLDIARPSDGGEGRTALLASEGVGPWQGRDITGCVDFARASRFDYSMPNGRLVYVPFGVDAVSYAVDRGAVVNLGFPASLSRVQLEAIYKCVITHINGVKVTPLLPRTGSDLRTYWLGRVDILEDELPSYPCIEQRNDTIDDSDGRVLGWDFAAGTADIVPFSVAQYVAQTNAGETHDNVTIEIEDRLGNAMVGSVNGVPATTGSVADPVLNMDFPLVHDVYNVVSAYDITGVSPNPFVVHGFIGPTSAVCRERNVIEAYGFGFRTERVPNDNRKLACGAMTLRSNL